MDGSCKMDLSVIQRISCCLLVLMLINLDTTNCMDPKNNTVDMCINGTDLGIVFDPPEIENLVMGDTIEVNITFLASFSVEDLEDVYLKVGSQNEDLARIMGQNEFQLSAVYNNYTSEEWNDETSNTTRIFNNISAPLFTVEGLFLGRTRLKFCLKDKRHQQGKSDKWQQQNNISDLGSGPYRVSVIRGDPLLDTLFLVGLGMLVFLGNIGMGCEVNLDVVKEVLKKPIAPVVGFTSQYIIMPLTSYGLVRLLGLEAGLALGLFTLGCVPGGNSSNMYTYLLKGDVSLSVTMTLISLLASLAMIPLWLFTLGRLISGEDANVYIPIENIFISLISMLVPVVIGIVLRRKAPKIADFLKKCLKPLFLILILFTSIFGSLSSRYIFEIITWKLILAGCLLPYIGFTLGFVVAYVTRQPFKRLYTIAIETGLQNTGIAVIILRSTLVQPEADISVVSPIVSTILAPIPLVIAVVAFEIRKRCCKKEKEQQEPEVAQQATDNHVTTKNGDVKQDKTAPCPDVNGNEPVPHVYSNSIPTETSV